MVVNHHNSTVRDPAEVSLTAVSCEGLSHPGLTALLQLRRVVHRALAHSEGGR